MMCICENADCGKEFTRKPGKGRKPRYCSARCRLRAFRMRNRAECREAARRLEAASIERSQPQVAAFLVECGL